MDKALEDIRLQIGAENLTDVCSRDGCEVSLTDVPRDRIIVDADLAFPAHGDTGERCDFIVFIISSDRNLLGVSNVNYFVRLASIILAAFIGSWFHCSVVSVGNSHLPV